MLQRDCVECKRKGCAVTVPSTQIVGVGLAAAFLGPIVLHVFSPLHTVARERKTDMTACFRSCQGSVLLGVFIATESLFCWLLGGGQFVGCLVNCFATYWHHLICRVRPEGH